MSNFKKIFSSINTIGFVSAIAFAALSTTSVMATEPVSFAEDIFPIIQIRCQSCHVPGGEGFEKSGLDLRTYEGLMAGTKHGAMVVAGDPMTSNLLRLIDGKTDKSIAMPHKGKSLSRCDRDLFRQWVKEGAKNN